MFGNFSRSPLPPLPRAVPLPAVFVIVLASCALIALGTSYVWAQQYQNRIAPNVWIGTVLVGGLDLATARDRVQHDVDALLTRGVEIRVDETSATLQLATVVGGDIIEDVVLDVDASVQNALRAHEAFEPLSRTLLLLSSFLRRTDIPVPVTINRDRIETSVRQLFPGREEPPIDAGFQFSKTADEWSVKTTEAQPGRTFQWGPFFTTLTFKLENLETASLPLILIPMEADVSVQTASKTTGAAIAALEAAPYTFTYTSERWRRTDTWILDAETLSAMLIPSKDTNQMVTVNSDAFSKFLDSIASQVEEKPRDARFRIENGRVVEFVGSQEGLVIDREATRLALVEQLNKNEVTSPIPVAVTIMLPEKTTDEVNDLGITEILGVGISSYRGSPRNRIKNIRNGVRLLNGILIAPGETFSLLKALAPFTTENGYLPELVIKGDKIKPEIGGGLCQLGTTTFRAAMNSGLPILERSNHSLVVSYYNDPSNGNPGTDATIYEPAPDFKFLNDTSYYILFGAEMVEDKQELRFTFWGTSDGRRGSYSPPIVQRWIPAGEEKRIETLDLPPGKKECQAAHVGADASFVYRVEKPGGVVEERTFASHYRPLPKICLVGVEQLSTPTGIPPDANTSPPTSDMGLIPFE